jgi:hypothetical protein
MIKVIMETKTTTKSTLMQGDILTPKNVMEESLLPGIGLTWLYKHWASLGGVTIGTKKFILREILYASLQGKQEEEQAPDVANQSEGAGKGFSKVSNTNSTGDGNNQLGNKKRSRAGRAGVGKVSAGNVLTDHSDEFGFSQFV